MVFKKKAAKKEKVIKKPAPIDTNDTKFTEGKKFKSKQTIKTDTGFAKSK